MALAPNSTNKCLVAIVDMNTITHISIAPAVLIVLVLSILQKRQLHSGIVVPLNLLGSSSKRWSYAAAFGAMFNSVLGVLQENTVTVTTDLSSLSPWVRLLVAFIFMFEVCFVFYPIFACLTTSLQFLGALFGFAYTIMWVVIQTVNVVDFIVCMADAQVETKAGVIVILLWVPTQVCLLFLLVTFVKMFIKGVQRRGPYATEETARKIEYKHHTTYVKHLLRKNKIMQMDSSYEDDEELRFIDKLRLRLSRKPYRDESIPEFFYSTRIVCTFFLGLLFVYSSTLQAILGSAKYLPGLDRIFQVIADMITGEQGSDISGFSKAMEVAWWICIVLTSLIILLQVNLTLASYKKHMLMAYSGDWSFLPEYYRLCPAHASAKLARGLKYTGFQIAFLTWGYFVAMFLLIAISSVLIGIGWAIARGLFVTLLQSAIIPIAILILLFYAQLFLSAKFFLQPKINEDDASKPLALRNMKWFHLTHYYLFLANIIIGFILVFSRFVMSALLSGFLMCRLDRTIIMRGHESKDKGHMSYLGMIETEHAHTHPVVIVFAQLLVDSIGGEHKRIKPTHLKPPVPKSIRRFSDQSTISSISQQIEEEAIGEPEDAVAVENGEAISTTIAPVSDKELQLMSPADLETLGHLVDTLPKLARKRARNRWFLAYSLIRNRRLRKKRSWQVFKDKVGQLVATYGTPPGTPLISYHQHHGNSGMATPTQHGARWYISQPDNASPPGTPNFLNFPSGRRKFLIAEPDFHGLPGDPEYSSHKIASSSRSDHLLKSPSRDSMEHELVTGAPRGSRVDELKRTHSREILERGMAPGEPPSVSRTDELKISRSRELLERMLATKAAPSGDGNINIKRSASEEPLEKQNMAKPVESVETINITIQQQDEDDTDHSADTTMANTDSDV